MATAPRLTAALAAALTLAQGCVQYNAPCSGLVEEGTADVTVGYLQGRVYLDKNRARHANNAIGRMAAEAFVEAFPDDADKPEFGILNGGALRNEGGEAPNGECVTRNVIGTNDTDEDGKVRTTAVTNADIHQILLFENAIYAVDLTERELFQVLEHSAAALFPATTPVASPSGRFLHVSGRAGTQVTVRIDCTRAPAVELPGSGRVTEIRIGARVLNPLETARKIRVAMPEFLLRGGDGYSMLEPLRTDSSRNPIQSQEDTGIDNDLVAAWMKEAYGTPEGPLRSFERDLAACTQAEHTGPSCTADCCQAPLKLVGCAIPLAPPE